MYFTGQVKDGKPDGFVRAVNAYGNIYEGMMNANCQREGFGRYMFTDGDQEIGWYKNNKCDGNKQYIYDDGTVLEEGFYENDYLKGPYKEDINEYLQDARKYLKVKDLEK